MGSLSLIAGVMGMNFGLKIFETGFAGFITVLGLMLAIALVALLIGRMRRWY
jgi:Mg2+ and Co2+ transporter CorA